MSKAQYNVDESVIKKPGDDKPLTPDEEAEWIKCALDPRYFMNTYCYVVGAKGKMLYEPRDYQEDLVDDILDNRFLIANAPRQTGKTATLSLLGLHAATFKPDVTCGYTSYRQSACKDILQRIKYAYENLPSFLKSPVVLYNQSEVRFTNGSTMFVQVTSSQIFRGRSFGDGSMAVFDEYAHVDLETAEAAYEAAMPAMEGGGSAGTSKAIIISTPNGTGSNKYAQIAFGAMEGSNGWHYHKVDPTRIPNRDEAWRKKTIRTYGEARFRQEFMGEFISSKPLLISSMVVEAIKTEEPKYATDDLRIFVDDFNNRTIAVGVDVGEGVGLDSSTFQVIDLDTLEQLAEYENNVFNQNMFTRDLLSTLKMLKKRGCGDIFLGVEKNGVGQGVLRLLESSDDPIMDEITMINDVDKNGISTGRKGLTTTNRSKIEACGLFKELVESGKLKLKSVNLLNQLRLFMQQGVTFKAEKGGHDDLVSSFLVIMMMMPQLANYEDSVDQAIHDLNENIDDETWGIIF